MNKETNEAIEELRELVSKINNDILNLTMKYNQMISLMMTVSMSEQKINTKLDNIQNAIYAIRDSISTTSSSSSIG